MSSQTIRAQQGSQPRFGDVRVGVVVAAMHRGEAKVRLLIRGSADKKRVDLVTGDVEDLFGAGTLTVDEILLRPRGEGRDEVVLTYRPPHD